jgi:hypothetical protein
MLGFQKGDVIVAYLKDYGFVGVGKIIEPTKRIRDVEINGTRLLDLDLKCKNMGENSSDLGKSEYVALVERVKTVSREEAKWKAKSGLYTTTHVKASLDGQAETIKCSSITSLASMFGH